MPLAPAVIRSLEEAGNQLLTFYEFPRAMWKSIRTTNALENLNREFRRRTKTQASFSSEESAVALGMYRKTVAAVIKAHKDKRAQPHLSVPAPASQRKSLLDPVWSKYSNAQRVSSLHLSKGCLNPASRSDTYSFRVRSSLPASSPRSRFEPAVRTPGGPVARHPQPRGRKPALRREIPWILCGFQGRLSC